MEIGGNQIIDLKDDNLLMNIPPAPAKILKIDNDKKFTIIERIKLIQIIKENE